MNDRTSFVEGTDVDEIITFLEAKNISPQKGVFILLSALYMMLSANGYSRIEMCRHINEAIMVMKEERDPETIQ